MSECVSVSECDVSEECNEFEFECVCVSMYGSACIAELSNQRV